MQRDLTALALLAMVLSGCAASPAHAPSAAIPDASVPSMTIEGLVQNDAFLPIAGANVTLRLSNQTTSTDAGGLFEFKGLPLAPYLVDVSAPGFDNATLTAEPQATASLSFVLQVAQSLRPRNETVVFHGFIQCALEVLIITPSCDSLLTDPRVNGPHLFNDTSNFESDINGDWKTVIADVDFDPNATPGLDGLRMTLRALNDRDSFGDYGQYGHFHGSQPFTVRLEPGQSYPDGTSGPLPANSTLLRFEMYPQGLLWHPGGVGVLGVGTGLNVQFDLYVTVFYNQPAPDGWSIFDQPE
jgi:hypothetical protein